MGAITSPVVLLAFLATMSAYSQGFGLSRDCKSVGRRCGDILDIFMELREESNDLDLDAVCQLTEEHMECYGECQAEIEAMPVVGLGMKIRDYLCNPSNRQQVTDVLSSRCLRDGSIDREFDGLLDSCVDSVMSGNMRGLLMNAIFSGNVDPQVCPVVSDFPSCISRAVGGKCGQEVRPAVNTILHIVFTDLVSVYLAPCLDGMVISK